jgi:hypothetical protein
MRARVQRLADKNGSLRETRWRRRRAAVHCLHSTDGFNRERSVFMSIMTHQADVTDDSVWWLMEIQVPMELLPS